MVSRIKDENYYQISGWMLNRLNLKGTQLNVYAIIYGFSQDGENAYTGSLQYLCDFIGTSKPTAIKALKELVDKDYIVKEEIYMNNVQFNKYKVNLQVLKKLKEGSKETLQGGSKETLPPSKETLIEGSKETLQGGSKETLPPSKETLIEGSKESLPNNKTNNNKNNNKNIIIKGKEEKEENTPTPQEEIKFKLGTYENVFISNNEITELVKEFGEEDTKLAINYLSEEIKFKNYETESHFLAIKRWVINAVKEKRIKKQELEQREQRAKEIEAKQKADENKYMFNGKRISDLTQAEYEEYLKQQQSKPAPIYNWLEPAKNVRGMERDYSEIDLNKQFDDLDKIEI